jgi:hypothetical protein
MNATHGYGDVVSVDWGDREMTFLWVKIRRPHMIDTFRKARAEYLPSLKCRIAFCGTSRTVRP